MNVNVKDQLDPTLLSFLLDPKKGAVAYLSTMPYTNPLKSEFITRVTKKVGKIEACLTNTTASEAEKAELNKRKKKLGDYITQKDKKQHNKFNEADVLKIVVTRYLISLIDEKVTRIESELKQKQNAEKATAEKAAAEKAAAEKANSPILVKIRKHGSVDDDDYNRRFALEIKGKSDKNNDLYEKIIDHIRSIKEIDKRTKSMSVGRYGITHATMFYVLGNTTLIEVANKLKTFVDDIAKKNNWPINTLIEV